MDSLLTDQHICLAAVQNSSVYFWSVFCDKNSSGSSSNTEISSLEISDSPSLTYKPQMTDTCVLRSIQWDPRLCKLAVIDHSGSAIFFRHLYTGKNHEYDQNASDITTFSLLSQNFIVTCIAYPQRSGRYLAVGTNTGLINLYKCRKQISFHSQLRCSNIDFESSSSNNVQPRCISWILNDRVIAAGYSNGCIVLFLAASSTPTGECENFILPFPSYPNHRNCSTPACNTLKTSRLDNTLLCCGYSDGSIILWSLQWPIIGNTKEYILNHWDPKSFLSIPVDINDCEYCIDLALSSDKLIFSAGAPDMNLRVWNISPSCLKPMKTLSPADKQHGYISVDLASNTSILATGLANGNIWFYNTHNLTSPIRSVCSESNVPVRLLSFSFTYWNNGETRFSSPELNCLSTLPNENFDAKSHTKLTSVQSIVTDTPLSSSRQPLHEVNNVISKYQPDTWASLFREFSIPDLSAHSNSSVFPPSDQSSIKSGSSEVNIDNVEKTVSLKPDINLNRSQQLKSSDYHDVNDNLNTNSLNVTNEWLDQYFNVRLRSMMSEMNWSHNELLFKFTKLEWKLNQMCEEFRSIVTQMRHENDLLRLALNQHSQF
ncbi:unnamed protein product [Schistosoma turkestanicum]|nr:unnamed protein product [Schistosoma turkestanicum]CAH8541010.1 unnamed protein product [Schistosoma turkestanicum]